MSIAAVSSSFVAAVREVAPAAAVDGTMPRGAARATVDSARRHELVDAVHEVLGTEGGAPATDEQAVFHFTHALMQDLRSLAGGAGDGARSAANAPAHAWGRREWSDLPQRIDALATAALSQPEVPPQPSPLTTTTAAVHLMQVPSSRLLEAFAALRQAIGNQADAPTSASGGELASFLERLSSELKPDARAGLPAGSVVNLTA